MNLQYIKKGSLALPFFYRYNKQVFKGKREHKLLFSSERKGYERDKRCSD